ncbi:MAG TPA: phytanoyl-CoA dioxygenase family protein [Aquihabitans sp.]|jgi:ectoine hydroxylase-related dioxygenase (phytanoyl-CoA dioxygenase family)|nr:phytanoyl-CoA dioxygenase family protein [Aquihabitans sp.]
MSTTVATTADDRAEHLRRIEVDGYTIVPDAIEPDLVDALVERLDRLEHELGVQPSRNGFEGRTTVRIYNLLAHGAPFEQVPVHPAVLPLVEGVLDPGCLVSSLSSIAIDPGEVAQPIHADDQLMPLAKPHAPTVCNSMWALTDFTEENGATRVIPGSHLADGSPEYGATFGSAPAEMAKGSVLVWHGSLWHGGGANATDRRRIGLAMNYCAGWVRQQENQQLGVSVDTARSFSPRLRELCGYGVYQGLIGHIDRRSPADVVLGPPPGERTGDSEGGMVWDQG